MDYHLALSLGHNSSVVLIENGRILNAYENERLTGIKSDSQFPIHAIDEISKYHDLKHVNHIYVSHWSTFGSVDEMSEKHWRIDLLRDRCPNAKILNSIDHHDSHVEALRVFTNPRKFDWEIVADGFGNFNEVISVYHKGTLVHRNFGFDKSIGLLYQYTTAYLGLTMNKDEYKLLGYESHIQEVCSGNKIKEIEKAADCYAKKYLKGILRQSLLSDYDLVAGLEALPNIRLKIRDYNDYVMFTKLKFKRNDLTDWEKKVIVAFFIQSTVEKIMSSLIDHFMINEVALTGGLFMNVKLNNVIAKKVDKISILPICGDLSCGLGVYQFYNRNLKWPNHLIWSKRDLNGFISNDNDLRVFDYLDEALIELRNLLRNDYIVNFVRKDMEYGARALGHTTTFAIATEENVDYINEVNGRNTVMPMAGMIHKGFILAYKDSYKVYKSLEYMIITLDNLLKPSDVINGVHHNHPTDGSYTNRVQLIKSDHFLDDILDEFKVLINTSFNYHGQTIPLSQSQIFDTIRYQKDRDRENKIITIICKS